MAVQNPFFGRREPEPFQPRTGSGAIAGSLGSSTMPNTQAGSAIASAGVAAHGSGMSAAQQQQPQQSESSGSKLTVGPNIKLKGVEITDCDTLVVEGTVEATMDSRVIQIAEQGAFRGSADIDIAEIRGEFNGTLNVREKLMIFSTGKVTGKIRYGKLVVEEGGQLSGEVEMGVGKNSPRAAQGAAAMPADQLSAPQAGRDADAASAAVASKSDTDATATAA